MKNRYGVLFFIVMTFMASATSNVSANDKFIKVGTITSEPKEEVETYRPFVQYLASQLKEQGIESEKVVVATSVDEMVSLLKKREIDLYIDSPFPVLQIGAKVGVEPLVRRWKKGVVEYNSVIFVRKDSGINSIQELNGKMISFEEPFSTSSSLLPRSSLLQAGILLEEKESFMDLVPEEKLGYVNSYDDETTMMWVLRNKVDAGALSMKNFKELAKKRADELKIIFETISVPRQVVAYRKDLDPNIVLAVKEVLLNAHMSKDGQSILKGFEKTAKFDEFPKGDQDYFLPIQELSEYLK